MLVVVSLWLFFTVQERLPSPPGPVDLLGGCECATTFVELPETSRGFWRSCEVIAREDCHKGFPSDGAVRVGWIHCERADRPPSG